MRLFKNTDLQDKVYVTLVLPSSGASKFYKIDRLFYIAGFVNTLPVCQEEYMFTVDSIIVFCRTQSVLYLLLTSCEYSLQNGILNPAFCSLFTASQRRSLGWRGRKSALLLLWPRAAWCQILILLCVSRFSNTSGQVFQII